MCHQWHGGCVAGQRRWDLPDGGDLWLGRIFTLSVAALDVNGDGKPDLLVANCCANQNCSGDGAVGVLLGMAMGLSRRR